MLGNQIAVLKGAKNPNAGKLLVEFLLTKEGSDLFVEGEAIYSFRKGYKAPAAAAPYLMDLSKHKLIDQLMLAQIHEVWSSGSWGFIAFTEAVDCLTFNKQIRALLCEEKLN